MNGPKGYHRQHHDEMDGTQTKAGERMHIFGLGLGRIITTNDDCTSGHCIGWVIVLRYKKKSANKSSKQII